MFMLYPLLLAVVVGMLSGGRMEGLAALRIRLWWLAIGGLLAQVVLFSEPVADLVGDAGTVAYVASSIGVLAAVIANLAYPGAALIALGGVSNLAAILANGGYMPTSAAALQAAGIASSAGYSNSREMAQPALAPLTDVLAMPDWLPYANVLSIGDVLIGLGVAWLVVWAMRVGPEPATKVPSPSTADGTGGGWRKGPTGP
jgi:hypothetical protein